MVTKYLPLPADSGGKQRSLAILERLAKLGSVESNLRARLDPPYLGRVAGHQTPLAAW